MHFPEETVLYGCKLAEPITPNSHWRQMFVFALPTSFIIKQGLEKTDWSYLKNHKKTFRSGGSIGACARTGTVDTYAKLAFLSQLWILAHINLRP